jgi:hypothetical protein
MLTKKAMVGMIPFIWATNEFWRRIAAGSKNKNKKK